MERIKQILDKYTPEDAQRIHDTCDMLCSKGIPNGVYQDYALLIDLIEILSICEFIVQEGGEGK
jgi:hypothetical protein